MTPNAPQNLARAIQTNQWLRNGRYPDANFYAQFAAQVNHIIRWGCKEPFSWATPITSLASSSGTGATRDRWRFAFQTSRFVRELWVLGVMAPATAHSGADGRGVLTISDDPAYAATVGTATFSGGSLGSDTPKYFTPVFAPVVESDGSIITIGSNTDHFGKFEEKGDGRLLSATVFEVAIIPDSAQGYIEDGGAIAYDSSILDKTRQAIADALRGLWLNNGAQAWNWTVEYNAITRTLPTPLNVVDTTSTAVSAATPGATLDLRLRSTKRRGTVPMVIQAFGSNAGNAGSVVLKDSSGTILATIAINSAAQWYQAPFNAPATLAKYDIQFAATASTTNLFAVSIYPLE